MRRVGFLTASLGVDDPELQTRNSAFVLALREFGWAEGNNVRVEFRSGAGKASELRKHAAELVSLADVVLANGGHAVSALQDVSRTVPIVFVQVTDPVGAGFVDSLARPGGNATGFTNFEYGIVAKWLELLKEVAPAVRQVAVLRDPSNAAGSGQWGAIQLAASSFGVELSSINSRAGAGEIERAFAGFARRPDGGLIVTANTGAGVNRDLFVNLAARHKLPAVYPSRYWIANGGLVGYGAKYRRPISASGWLHKSDSQRRETGRPAGAGANQVPACDQSQDREGAWHHGAATLLARADEVIE